MLINKPVIRNEGNKTIVSSRIQFNSVDCLPAELWFEVGENEKNNVSDRCDAFLAALFLLSMRLGENIEVAGEVSPTLIKNINIYQNIYNHWFPEKYSIVNILTDNLRPDDFTTNKIFNTCTFTGGVDSFYTLWKHLPRNCPDKERQVNSCLFIHGLDADVDNYESYETAKISFENILRNEGLSLISVRTNIRKFTDYKIEWNYAFASCISATALIFQKSISNFIIASSYTYEQLHPWGSHPATDRLISTESFKTIHYGADTSRLKKTVEISNWSLTYDNLRVCCWLEKNGLDNCCRCSKCIRTMLPLEIAGKLKKYSTFKLPLTPGFLKRYIFLYEGETVFIREIMNYARGANRNDIVRALHASLIISWIPAKIVKLLAKYDFTKKIAGSKVAKKIYFTLMGGTHND